MWLLQTAGKVLPHRVLPGLLPLPGSKNLWLSQHCALIYPLTLCFSPSLPTLHPFQIPSLPHSCSGGSFIKWEMLRYKICLNYLSNDDVLYLNLNGYVILVLSIFHWFLFIISHPLLSAQSVRWNFPLYWITKTLPWSQHGQNWPFSDVCVCVCARQWIHKPSCGHTSALLPPSGQYCSITLESNSLIILHILNEAKLRNNKSLGVDSHLAKTKKM